MFPPASGVPPLHIDFTKPPASPLDVDVYKSLRSGSAKVALDVDHVVSRPVL